jgi:uncharacterized membrane protein
MKILEWAITIVATIVALGWAYGIRTYVRQGQGVTQQTVNTTMLGFISIIAILLPGISPLHLLWVLPISWLMGTFSLAFPFSLLSIPGRFFGLLCCVGLDKEEVARNTAKVDRLQELIKSGLSPDDAVKKVREENL